MFHHNKRKVERITRRLDTAFIPIVVSSPLCQLSLSHPYHRIITSLSTFTFTSIPIVVSSPQRQLSLSRTSDLTRMPLSPIFSLSFENQESLNSLRSHSQRLLSIFALHHQIKFSPKLPSIFKSFWVNFKPFIIPPPAASLLGLEFEC